MNRPRILTAVTAIPSVGWRAVSAAALRLRGITREEFIPPWEASVVDDAALNRPLNLLFRILRWKVGIRARTRIPGLRLRKGVTIAIDGNPSSDNVPNLASDRAKASLIAFVKT